MRDKKKRESAVTPQADTEEPVTPEALPFPVTCIGASAGGLEAFGALLRSLPANTGMAFVLVSHLPPDHASALAELLSRATEMPVAEVREGMSIEPNRIYVIPPGREMVMRAGKLHLESRPTTRGAPSPINRFMTSLADQQGHRSIGVILSGTGSDGTIGLEEIKANGGITFAQDSSAQYDGMPKSAMDAGCVDSVLPPGEIAAELARIASSSYVAPAAAQPETDRTNVARIIRLVHDATGLDFTNYKRSTLDRRIARRMVRQKVESLAAYLRFLRAHPEELEELRQDILISVTGFFRDPEAYEAITSRVFPKLIAKHQDEEMVRFWVLGCSTGEEAYSLAMAFTEFSERAKRRLRLQIFATDVNGAAVEKARAGIYSSASVQTMTPERRRRFFSETGGRYRVHKSIRDLCVFARHNALTDPPFSRVDLISCRNVLIYLDASLQQRIIRVVNYALTPGGYLWLGNSESMGAHADVLGVEDARHKIYFRDRSSVAAPMSISAPLRLSHAAEGRADTAREIATVVPDVHREADRILLARYTPPAVLVDDKLQILQFRGDTSPWLSPAPGKASLQLFQMLRGRLLVPVRGAIAKARKLNKPVRETGLRIARGGAEQEFSIEVIPLDGSDLPAGCLLVLFEGDVVERPVPARRGRASRDESARALKDIEQELAATKDYLQSVIEQREAANEQLQSANEEVQSANEELQSINEELETSTEEIQSSNEELATVNDELRTRNAELVESNNDFLNLLSSVSIGIVMLTADLRIRRFTPVAERMLNLIEADLGRAIEDINLNVIVPDLAAIVKKVISADATQEREAHDRQGRWYLVRILPYRTVEGAVDGAVVVYFDVDALKRGAQEIRESEARFRLIADSAPVLIWMNGITECEFVNRAYLEFLGVDESRVLGRGWTEFIHPEDLAVYEATIENAVRRGKRFEAQLRLRRADGEYRWLKAVGQPRTDDRAEAKGYVGSMIDVSNLMETEQLRRADIAKNEFLAMLAHELRNPLAPLANMVQLLGESHGGDSSLAWARNVLDRQVRTMVRMVDDLLDVSRITLGKIDLRPETMDLAVVVRETVEEMRPRVSETGQRIIVDLPKDPLYLRGDPVRLEQVISNLVNNASKFSAAGATITISASAGRDTAGEAQVTLRVRDDGAGITAELLPYVFDLFRQAEQTLARRKGGLGLGLTLVRKLVELHGGTIEAHSDGPNLGSEFVVRLPAAPWVEPLPQAPAVDTPRSRRSSASVTTPTRTRRILVVDDNVDASDALGALLRHKGHTVEIFHDGETAIEAAARSAPDIVLLDIGLPGLDGFEVARRLRAAPGTQHALIAAITGYGGKEAQQRALKSGFDEFLVKPVDLESLAKILKAADRKLIPK